jgi:hypothetical protein
MPRRRCVAEREEKRFERNTRLALGPHERRQRIERGFAIFLRGEREAIDARGIGEGRGQRRHEGRSL